MVTFSIAIVQILKILHNLLIFYLVSDLGDLKKYILLYNNWKKYYLKRYFLGEIINFIHSIKQSPIYNHEWRNIKQELEIRNRLVRSSWKPYKLWLIFKIFCLWGFGWHNKYSCCYCWWNSFWNLAFFCSNYWDFNINWGWYIHGTGWLSIISSFRRLYSTIKK